MFFWIHVLTLQHETILRNFLRFSLFSSVAQSRSTLCDPTNLELYFLLHWIYCLSFACCMFDFIVAMYFPTYYSIYFHMLILEELCTDNLFIPYREGLFKKLSSQHIRDLFVFLLWVPFWRPDTHISWVLILCTLREYCGKFSVY